MGQRTARDDGRNHGADRERKGVEDTDNCVTYAAAERGFLRSEKNGKEREYFPLVAREDYLKFETGNFMKQYHDNSLFNLINTLYDDKALTDEDIDELLKWAKERRD